MIVYVYNKHTNEKLDVIKNVYRVASMKENFNIFTEEGIERIKKNDIKLVIYGF